MVFPQSYFPDFPRFMFSPNVRIYFFGSYIHFKVFPKENRCFGVETISMSSAAG